MNIIEHLSSPRYYEQNGPLAFVKPEVRWEKQTLIKQLIQEGTSPSTPVVRAEMGSLSLFIPRS